MRVPAFSVVCLTCALTHSAEDSKIPSIALVEGKVVTVHAGQQVNLTLPVQLGTGYSWVLKRLPANVVMVESHIKSEAANLPGGVETQVFRVILKAPEVEHLLFELRRPVAPSQKPIQQVRITLQPDH